VIQGIRAVLSLILPSGWRHIARYPKSRHRQRCSPSSMRQVIGRKRTPPSAVGWDSIESNSAQIGIGEGDDQGPMSGNVANDTNKTNDL